MQKDGGMEYSKSFIFLDSPYG